MYLDLPGADKILYVGRHRNINLEAVMDTLAGGMDTEPIAFTAIRGECFPCRPLSPSITLIVPMGCLAFRYRAPGA